MSIHDLFRGFFGFPPRDPSRDPQSDIFSDFFGPPYDSPMNRMDDCDDLLDPDAIIQRPLFESFESIAEHFGKASDGFFGSMDKMFEKLFSDFPFTMDIPMQVPSVTEDTLSPRDRMLKRPDSSKDSVQQQPFTGWKNPAEGSAVRKDMDLDGQITRENLDSILPSEREMQARRNVPPMPRSFGEGHAFSFSYHKKVTLPDGRTEEQQTRKDGDGNTETTFRRSYGNKTWTTTERSDSSGNKETVEDMVNLDESSVQDFKKKWGSPRLMPGSEAPPGTVTPSQPSSDRESYLSIFKNLFGFVPPH